MSDYLDSFLNGETDSIEKPSVNVEPSQDQTQPQEAEPAVIPQGNNASASSGPDKYDNFLNGDDSALVDQPPARAVNPADLHNALNVYDGVSPDQAARVDQLSKTHGIPFNMALDNQSEFEKVDEVKNVIKSIGETDAEGRPKFPNTADLISDPIKFAKWRDKVDQLKAIEQIIQEAKPITKLNYLSDLGASGLESLAGVFSNTLKGAETLARKINGPSDFEMLQKSLAQQAALDKGATSEEAQKVFENTASPKENIVYQAGQKLEDTTKTLAPGDPRLKDTFSHKVAGVLGMTGGFMLTGGLGELAKASEAANTIVALTSTAGGAYDEAMAKEGTTQEQALNASALTAPTGLLYTIVPRGMLERLFGKLGGAGTTSLVKTMVQEGTTATGLFAGQTVLSNAVAKQVYDKDRGYWDGAVNSGTSGGVGSAIASFVVSLATGRRVPVVHDSKAPNPDIVDMTENHYASAQAEAQRIQQADSQIKLLKDLQSAVAPEATTEGGTPESSRDPSDMAEFVEKGLQANGHPTEMEIDPETVHQVLFQDAKTDVQKQAAQDKLEQFAEDVGVSMDDAKELINKSIRDGTPFKVNTGRFIGKYGTDPIFDAITKQMQEDRDTAAENLANKYSTFEKDLEAKKTQYAEPTQFKQIREQLIKPADEGGAGDSAQVADDKLADKHKLLVQLAKATGESVQDIFNRTGLEIRTGEDGRAFVQRLDTPGASDEVIKSKLDSAVAEGRPVSKAVVDRLGVQLPESYIDYGGFYAKTVKGKELSESEKQILEKQAAQEMASMHEGDLSRHEELQDAIKAVGGLLSPKKIKAAGGLGGEAKAILDAAKKSPKLFRNDGLSPDKMVEALNARGFKFDGEAHLMQSIYDGVNQGRKVYAGADPETLFQGAPADESIVNKHGSLFAGEANNPRGAYQPINGKDVVHLFKTHDASTFLHEITHFITKEYESLVDSGLATPQVLADWNTLLKWVGSKDGKLTTEQREKIARGNERYHMEGKAPSPDLIDVFRRYKDRLMDLYKDVFALNVDMSDEVRSVYARWYASDKEISQANDFYNLQSVISNLNDKNVKAKQIESKVEKKTAAHEAALKEAKLKAATLDIDAKPVYRVLNNDKIDFESLRNEFGDVVANEIKDKFPQSFEEGGASIHDLAVKRGFESPDALVAELRNAIPREDAIAQRHLELITGKENQILSNEPSDVTPADGETHTQDTLKLLVDDTQRMKEAASHETSQEATKARIDAMRKGSQEHQLTVKAYRDSAREAISKLKAGEATEYYRFAQAEKRYGAEVVRYLQRGKQKEALASRMKQLFNHAMVLESIKARAEMQKIQSRYEYKKINALLKEGIENEFVSPLTTLLSRFGFSNRKPDVAYDFSKMAEIDPVLAAMVPDVVKGPVSGDYRKVLTLEELRTVDEFADTLIHVGRDVMRSLKEGKEVKTATVVGESITNMSQLKDKKLIDESKQGQIKMQKFLDLVSSSTIQQQFLTEMADNFSMRTSGKMGIMRQMYHEMVNRQVHESELQKEVAKDLDPIFKTLEGARKRIEKENGKFFDIAELPLPEELKKDYRGKWTAERLMAMLFNTGNEGNLLSLKNAFQYGPEQINHAAKFFTAEEIKAVQGVWNAIDKLYPLLDKAHFESYNRHIKKVEAAPFEYTSKDGTKVKLEGGYYPLKFDAGIDTQAARNAETDLMEQHAGVLRSSKPQDGFTLSRTPGHALPPLLSMNVLTKHIADTVHYATHADIIRDWNKVTGNEAWKKVFTDKFGNKSYEETRTWLKDQAQKAPPAAASGITRFWDRLFDSQRGLATVAAFGLNVKSGVLIHHSLLNAAHALEWKWLASGVRDLDAKTIAGLSTGDAWKQIADVSPYMKDHALSWDRDVRAMSEQMKPGGAGPLDRTIRKASALMGKEITLKDVRQASMILLTTGHQRMAAMVWKGALNKYMETVADPRLSQDENMSKAVKYADAMVQDTQASSLRAELNAVQRDQGFMRFLSAFMSWNFKYGGRLQYEARAWKEGKISTSDYISHHIHETLAPALVRTALLGAMTASAPTAWQWISSVPEMMMSWIPILKDVSKVFRYSTKTKKIDFDLTTAFPAAEGGKRIAKAGSSTLQYMNDTKELGPMLWDWARATDYFTGTGATKPAQDIYRFYENATSEDGK